MQEALRKAPADAKPVASLAAAVRLARVEAAEQSQAIAELRSAERARLEVLRDSLQPLLDQIPEGIDLFDMALAQGEHPRLFIDMIGFFEMGRDRRQYRFVQDTRHGRIIMAENERIEPMIDAARAYIARRMVERERALAGDHTLEQAAHLLAAPPSAPQPAPVAPSRARPRRRIWTHAARFLIEFLGAFTLGVLVLAGAIAAYSPLRLCLGAHLGWPPA